MLWDLYQQRQIHNVQGTASDARSRANKAEIRVAELEAKMDSLALTCQAIWELLREKHGLTDEDLEGKMQEIDLRDGVQDGKITSTPKSCPSCGRNSSSRRSQCMYCGATIGPANPFHS